GLAVAGGANGPRSHSMRARLTAGPALPRVTPFDSQDSALLRILTEADALLIRPANDPARTAGHEVDYLPL
ncbi:MAG: molybdopterin molybdenumtransferase MoeA, partial [Rhodobacterales bacterium]